MLRATLDTNVIVSGMISRQGAPAQVLDAWRERRYLLVTSPAIVAEVLATLHRPYIYLKFALTEEDLQQVRELLEHSAWLVPGTADVRGRLPADPNDEIVLACALDGSADIIVSGDHHLLDLGSFRGIPIRTPRDFLGLLLTQRS